MLCHDRERRGSAERHAHKHELNTLRWVRTSVRARQGRCAERGVLHMGGGHSQTYPSRRPHRQVSAGTAFLPFHKTTAAPQTHGLPSAYAPPHETDGGRICQGIAPHVLRLGFVVRRSVARHVPVWSATGRHAVAHDDSGHLERADHGT